MNREKEGRCKLTGVRGKFVDSHLIPKALTRPAVKGAPLIQSGRGSRPSKKWSSWYDGHLVTEAGEKILAELDSWAIPELRRHKLVWSGWSAEERELVAADFTKIPDTPWGAREIKGLDAARLRLFFLSLLWRAAATQLPEFSEIAVPPEDLEQLRKMLIDGSPDPLVFYPTTLTQLSTRGEIHNLAPLAQVKIIPAVGGMPERKVPIFRFYFEGLIAHIERPAQSNIDPKELGPLIVGGGDTLTVSTVTYEQSFQLNNLKLLQAEAHAEWPELMAKFDPAFPLQLPGLPHGPRRR